MDYATTNPRELAATMMAARSVRPAYRPVRRGGADKAAALLADVLVAPGR
jgi:hypothetical protein